MPDGGVFGAEEVTIDDDLESSRLVIAGGPTCLRVDAALVLEPPK